MNEWTDRQADGRANEWPYFSVFVNEFVGRAPLDNFRVHLRTTGQRGISLDGSRVPHRAKIVVFVVRYFPSNTRSVIIFVVK